VVVEFFSGEGYLGHESKSFGKVAEGKTSLEAVVFFGPHNGRNMRDALRVTGEAGNFYFNWSGTFVPILN
jgi:hypothetical protein